MNQPVADQVLQDASLALQNVLRAIIDVEKRSRGMQSPFELMREITTSEDWAWLRPLYALIADMDHAFDGKEPLPASEIAAIGAHAIALLSGQGAPVEQPFLERYRGLLQLHTEIAFVHGAAIQALRRFPPEPDNESERLHGRHQWNERRRHLRGN